MAITVVICALWALVQTSRSPAMAVDELEAWAEGPVQWLLLPRERKQLRRIDSTPEAIAFIEEFWARRDPDPATSGNPFRELFSQRVEAADVLYAEAGVRGSLSDRGRALILMGPPTHVTVSSEPALTWDPTSGKDSRVTMRRVDVEVWGYRLEDLPTGMLELWLERKKAAEDTLALTLTFRTVARRTALVHGADLLEVAARASVRGRTYD